MNDPMTLDPDSICRCCLSDRRETLRSLYDANIRDMFVACTSLPVNPGDGLPGRICSLCVFKCISWSSFKQLCERNEDMLRTQFGILPKEVEEADGTALASVDTGIEITGPAKNEDTVVVYNSNPLTNECSPVKADGEIGSTYVDVNNKFADIDNIVMEIPSNSGQISENEVEEFQGFLTKDENESKSGDISDEDLVTIVDEDDYIEYMNESKKIVSTSTSRRKSPAKPTLACDKCDLIFPSEDRLQSHLRTHSGQKPEVCPICNKGFDNVRALRRHHIKHTEGKLFTCTECGKSYKYQTSLRLHRKTHQNGKRFVCDLCGKSFIRAHGLKSHMLSHSTETPYGCDECGKRFKNEVMLRNHQLRSQGVKKFSCEQCEKSFASTAELRTHGRMHSGQKPFECSQCDKAYKTQSHLTVHMRTHTGARPYACDMCDQKFSMKKILTQHRMVHTGERPHICNICERPFRQRSTLNVHLRTHKSQHDADSDSDIGDSAPTDKLTEANPRK